MSRQMKQGQTMKKVMPKVIHEVQLRVTIPAGLANSKPPLGSQLAQRNINVGNFIQDFNTRTANIKEGIPLPCRVRVKGDGSYNLVIHAPPATYFLKQAAGIQKARMFKDDITGKITFKHIYEIASIKAKDPPMALLSLPQICEMMIGIANSCGIKVVRSIDPEEYKEFREKRAEDVRKYLVTKQDAQNAKLLRTG